MAQSSCKSFKQLKTERVNKISSALGLVFKFLSVIFLLWCTKIKQPLRLQVRDRSSSSSKYVMWKLTLQAVLRKTNLLSFMLSLTFCQWYMRWGRGGRDKFESKGISDFSCSNNQSNCLKGHWRNRTYNQFMCRNCRQLNSNCNRVTINLLNVEQTH